MFKLKKMMPKKLKMKPMSFGNKGMKGWAKKMKAPSISTVVHLKNNDQ